MQPVVERSERVRVEHRAGACLPMRGWLGQLDPTAAAAEAGVVREFPRGGQFAHAHQGKVDGAGGHALALPIKTVAHGGLGERRDRRLIDTRQKTRGRRASHGLVGAGQKS